MSESRPICEYCGKPIRVLSVYTQGEWVIIRTCRGRLNCIEYQEVVQRIEAGEQHSAIARHYNVSHTAIYKIARFLTI